MRNKKIYLLGYPDEETALMDSKDYTDVHPISLERAKEKQKKFERPDDVIIYKLVPAEENDKKNTK